MAAASTAFTVALTLKAFDEMSKTLNAATTNAVSQFTRLQDKIKQTGEQMTSFGRNALAAGFAGVGALAKPVEAFADLEDAGTRLQMTLMKSSGEVSEHFEQINQLAIRLGNRLPGTTADFQNMFAKLLQLGITEQSLLSGVGEAAAYLGVVLKRPYEETAEVAAKLKEATGTVDADMLKFIDTIQRTAHLGVDLRAMEYAFSHSAGALKLAGYQGLETSKSMATIFALLIKAGLSGERVGTNFAALMTTLSDPAKLEKANAIAEQFGLTLQFLNAQGRLVGPEELIRQLERLNALPPPARHEILKALFGPGLDMQVAAILMQQGVAGYREMVARMEAQADLNQRVARLLGTLRSLWDAATGTFTNALAAWVETFSPALKQLTEFFNALSERLVALIHAWPTVARWTGLAAVGFTGLALALGAVGLGVGLTLTAFAKALDGLTKLGHGAMVAGRWMLWGGQQAVRGFVWMGETALWAGRRALAGMAALGRGALAWARALWAATAAARAFTVALLANPWTWVAVTAVGAAYLIYRYWGPISAFFGRLWEGMKTGAAAAWSWMSGTLGRVASALRELLAQFAAHPLKIALDLSPLGLLMHGLNALVKYVTGLDLMAAGAKLIESLWKGMLSAADKPIQAVKELVGKVRALLPFSPAKEGPLADLHRIRLVETIAETVRPAPLVSAMQRTAAAVVVAAPLTLTPTLALPRDGGGIGEELPPLAIPAAVQQIQTVRDAVAPLSVPPVVQTIQQQLEPLRALPVVAAPLTLTPTLASPMQGEEKGGGILLGPRVLDSYEVLRSVERISRTERLERERGAPITIHYAPVVTVTGEASRGTSREAILETFRRYESELLRLIEEAQRKRDRGVY